MSFRELSPKDRVERSNRLSVLLIELSKADDLFNGDGEVVDRDRVEKYLCDVRSIYGDGYRQRYSDLLRMLNKIQGPNKESQMDQLTFNLDHLVELLRTPADEPYFLSLNKLTDHIILEIQRKRDYGDLIRATEKVRDDADSKLDELSRELDIANKAIEEAHEEAQRSKMEMVAILSIFSAIVVAFTGGLDFFGGTISAAGNSIFDVAIAVLLCGLMLFNIIAFLMYMVLAVVRLHDKPNDPIGKGRY